MTDLIEPAWPAPATVRAVSTTRRGGFSKGEFDSLNMGHGRDRAEHVDANRTAVAAAASLPSAPVWLEQVHGSLCVEADSGGTGRAADASFSTRPGTVCVVMTADCLPVLFCDRAGTRVAVAHAGWRGLGAGVLEATVAALGAAPGELLVWLGPAIGAEVYEVGAEVRDAFVGRAPEDAAAFRAHGHEHWLADLYALARARLRRLGVTHITGGEHCTFSEPERFYSYRRDGSTGRMASFIWLVLE